MNNLREIEDKDVKMKSLFQKNRHIYSPNEFNRNEELFSAITTWGPISGTDSNLASFKNYLQLFNTLSYLRLSSRQFNIHGSLSQFERKSAGHSYA